MSAVLMVPGQKMPKEQRKQLDIADRLARDVQRLRNRITAVDDRGFPITEDDLYAAFEAGFALGRQNQQLPGPYGSRLRSAFERWLH